MAVTGGRSAGVKKSGHATGDSRYVAEIRHRFQENRTHGQISKFSQERRAPARRAPRQVSRRHHDRRHVVFASPRSHPAPRDPGLGIRALDGPRDGVVYRVAIVQREAGCTCPDHETTGATCKHLMALRAIGILPRSARTAREAAARESARAAGRPAKARADLAARIQQSPAAAPVAPARAGRDPLARARRRHEPVAPASPASPAPVAPASAAAPFTKGFRAAVNDHVTALAKGGA